MTNVPEPNTAFVSSSSSVPWWWLCTDADGRVVEPADGRQEFPTRSDAESWVGEFYADLADEGIAAVTLFEGEREVYGPMSLGTYLRRHPRHLAALSSVDVRSASSAEGRLPSSALPGTTSDDAAQVQKER